MIFLAEWLFKANSFQINKIIVFLLMLIDVALLSTAVYVAEDIGIYLSPLYLFLIYIYSSKLPTIHFVIVAVTMLGFAGAVEFSDYWQLHGILKGIVFYALVIPSISYFIYVRKRNEALVDPLTSLPNRTLFQNKFQTIIKNARKVNGKAALLFLDLNGFKQVNDTLGHNVGDMLLKLVAVRIKSAIRDNDTIARLGGDEFAIILSDIKNIDIPTRVAEQIIRKFDEPYHVAEKLIEVGVSIGISIFPDHSDDIGDLIRFSDVAMYTAKKEKTGYAIYSSKYSDSDLESLKIIADLRFAIKEEKLEMVYQPKININTKKVVGFEALLRWNHEELGLIPPRQIISLAEESNLISELTYLVINTALRHCAEWGHNGHAHNVSINIAARDLQNGKMMTVILSAIEKYRLKPDMITLEITETTLTTHSDLTIRNLIGLNMMGVCLSIDDFGSGHASMVYVQQLPIHEIKIDKAFVDTLMSSSRSRKIVQSIIHLAHDIDCHVVAEGVETEAVMLALKEMGCDVIQGFWVSIPMYPDKVIPWIEEYES